MTLTRIGNRVNYNRKILRSHKIADMNLNVPLSPSFYVALKKELTSGWGCRDPPATWLGSWADGVTWFSENTTLSDFSTVDEKMLKILAHLPPDNLIYHILGYQSDWEASASSAKSASTDVSLLSPRFERVEDVDYHITK